MSNKPKTIIFLFVIVIINYITTRFIFFNIHGMKDFADTMSLLSAALTCIFVLSNNLLASLCSSFGNIVGFIIGYLFNTTVVDYITGNTNNYWLIWMVSYSLIVVIGMFVSKLFHVKHKKVN